MKLSTVVSLYVDHHRAWGSGSDRGASPEELLQDDPVTDRSRASGALCARLPRRPRADHGVLAKKHRVLRSVTTIVVSTASGCGTTLA